MKKATLIFFTLFAFGAVKAQTSIHPNLKGYFIMKGANCAGFDFTDSKTVLWYAELQCNYGVPMRLTWLNKDMFALRDKERLNETSPPRVYIFQILKNDGKELVLRSPWTGWGEGKDDIETYIRK